MSYLSLYLRYKANIRVHLYTFEIEELKESNFHTVTLAFAFESNGHAHIFVTFQPRTQLFKMFSLKIPI